MASQTAIGLTLRDLAILADGTGNIPDDTARRLAPLIRHDPRVAAEMDQLQQMADDANVARLADGLFTFEILETLLGATWETPRDVLDPNLEIPYRELIEMSQAMARRSAESDKEPLIKIVTRLEVWYGAHVAGRDCFQRVVRLLRSVPAGIANRAIERLSRVVNYRDESASQAQS